KYSAAVASASWLTDAAYPLRVHKVFLHFPKFVWKQNLSLQALADLLGASLIISCIFEPPPNAGGFFFAPGAGEWGRLWEISKTNLGKLRFCEYLF
ncbi:hypothetical protein KQI10_04685, partial [Pseudoflavonifractor sp. MSJ-30]|uniref:hypothetical protein n=1 Tax=Pseudoflavonifractor sp. MSJ-30 TaxID=2841525 RepID=UPI001C117D3F